MATECDVVPPTESQSTNPLNSAPDQSKEKDEKFTELQNVSHQVIQIQTELGPMIVELNNLNGVYYLEFSFSGNHLSFTTFLCEDFKLQYRVLTKCESRKASENLSANLVIKVKFW